MPGGDGTGPLSRGPMTGGGFGHCSAGPGRGNGFGRGQGGRNRRWAQDGPLRQRMGVWNKTSAPRSPDIERNELQRQKAALETELEHLRSRIAELNQS